MIKAFLCPTCLSMVTNGELQDHRRNGCPVVEVKESEETKFHNDIFQQNDETIEEVKSEVVEEKPKRIRRTKAQIEAEKLAEKDND